MRARMCVSPCLPVCTMSRCCMPDLFHCCLPWVLFSLSVGLGFPCATMITFTSTVKSRRTQITVMAPYHHLAPAPSHLRTLVKYDGEDLRSLS